MEYVHDMLFKGSNASEKKLPSAYIQDCTNYYSCIGNLDDFPSNKHEAQLLTCGNGEGCSIPGEGCRNVLNLKYINGGY